MREEKKSDLHERFAFRNIRSEEGEQAAAIEQACFPPKEACTKKMMLKRAAKAREIMRNYLKRERENGRRRVLLTCVESKVKMYEKMGFQDAKIANSSWGGNQWYEMSCVVNPFDEESLREGKS